MASPLIDEAVSPDFQAMNLAELRAEALRLARVLELCNDQRERIFTIIGRRQARQAAQQKINALTTEEKDALRDILNEEAG